MSGETFYRSSINLKTKTISSEIAYSNQSTRTLTTTPLQTYIVVNASSGQGTGQKVQGGWAGAFGNVVDKKHMTHPLPSTQK